MGVTWGYSWVFCGDLGVIFGRSGLFWGCSRAIFGDLFELTQTQPFTSVVQLQSYNETTTRLGFIQIMKQLHIVAIVADVEWGES